VKRKKHCQLLNTLVLTVCILFASCFGNEHRYPPPVKQEDIPDETFWVGGANGGNWYLVESVDKLRKEAVIDVYNDQSGELVVSKVFKVDCSNEDGIDWNNLKDQIQSFDGNKIKLEIKGIFGMRRYCYLE
jgi:hypothetical protein